MRQFSTVDSDEYSAVPSTKYPCKNRHNQHSHRHRHHHGHHHREQSKGETDSGLSSSNVAGIAYGDKRKERINRVEDSKVFSVSSLRYRGDTARASISAQQRTGHWKDSKDGFIVTLTRRGTSGAAMEALGEGSPGQDRTDGAALALSGVDEVIIGQSSRAMRSVTKEKTTPLRYSFPLSSHTPPASASASAHGSLPRHCHPVVPPRGPDS